jgi:hypothetical protein
MFDLLVLVLDVMQLILEGMGRALHTNLNARFKCDALKVCRFHKSPILSFVNISASIFELTTASSKLQAMLYLCSVLYAHCELTKLN